MVQQKGKDERFVEYLHGFHARQDRGALAALRRGLGKQPGEAPEMFRYLGPWFPDPPTYIPWEEEAYYLVASLFALYPEARQPQGQNYRRNLGASFAALERASADAKKEEQDRTSPVERRFVALLNADRDDLATHLRHGISLLKSKEAPVDWALLLRDLQRWSYEDRRVQRAWAGAFWGRGRMMEDSHDGDASPPDDDHNDDTDTE